MDADDPLLAEVPLFEEDGAMAAAAAAAVMAAAAAAAMAKGVVLVRGLGGIAVPTDVICRWDRPEPETPVRGSCGAGCSRWL